MAHIVITIITVGIALCIYYSFYCSDFNLQLQLLLERIRKEFVSIFSLSLAIRIDSRVVGLSMVYDSKSKIMIEFKPCTRPYSVLSVATSSSVVVAVVLHSYPLCQQPVCVCVFVGCCLATKSLNLNNTRWNGWR